MTVAVVVMRHALPALPALSGTVSRLVCLCTAEHDIHILNHAAVHCCLLCVLRLQTIDTATLIRAWDLEGQPDIVSAGVSVLRRRIARLSELLQAGHVTAEVGGLVTYSVCVAQRLRAAASQSSRADAAGNSVSLKSSAPVPTSYMSQFVCVPPQVRHAIAQPRDTAIISAIHSLQPLSMSWSNVPDYMVAKVRAAGSCVQPQFCCLTPNPAVFAAAV